MSCNGKKIKFFGDKQDKKNSTNGKKKFLKDQKTPEN